MSSDKQMPEAKRMFWISWNDREPDYRPLNDPPNEAVMGWWHTGYSGDDAVTICALVAAKNEAAAKNAICKDWPEASDWRFCEEKPSNFKLSNRFAVDKPWMWKRLATTPERGER